VIAHVLDHIEKCTRKDAKQEKQQEKQQNKVQQFESIKINYNDYLPLLLLLYLQKINIKTVRDIFHYYLIDCCVNNIDFATQLLFLIDSHSYIDISKNPGLQNENVRLCSTIGTTALRVLKHEILDHIDERESQRIITKNDETKFDAETTDLSENKNCSENQENDSNHEVNTKIGGQSSSLKEQLHSERKFITHLTNISRKLTEMKHDLCPKEELRRRLVMELTNVNFNLPGRLWLPGLYDMNHHVVRIPPNEAILLNSAERVPYMIYVEVVKCQDKSHDDPPKPHLSKSLENISQTVLFTSSPLPRQENLDFVASEDKFCPARIRKKLEDFVVQQETSEDDLKSENNADLKFNVPEFRNPESDSNESSSKDSDSKHQDFNSSSSIQDFQSRKQKIKETSPYGDLENWDLISVIVKANDNLVQESLAMIMVQEIQNIFQEEELDLWLNPYKIQPISQDSGIIETIVDAISIHQLKKISGSITLLEFFEKTYPSSSSMENAVDCFIKSCAAYSIVCYLLQVKDRHNGNILIDKFGHVIHIDYGFFLQSSPGPNSLTFEQAPFKLSDEFLQVINNSETSPGENLFKYKNLMTQGFLAIKKHSERLIDIIQIITNCSLDLPCLNNVHLNSASGAGQLIVEEFKYRLHSGLTEDGLKHQIDCLVSGAKASWTTGMYDQFQYWTNGIL
jgi:phosphatidylinositol 4-kinase